MSYPHAIATGNAVIAAALAWDERRDEDDLTDCPYFRRGEPGQDPYGTCDSGCQTEPACHTDRPHEGWPSEALRVAVAAHRAATAIEHTQGPDIDHDETPS